MNSPSARQMLNKVPEVTIYFWVIKILCTTVGETAADFLNDTLGFGLSGTSVVMGVLLVAVLILQFRKKKYIPSVYWLAVVLISVVGTLITDNLRAKDGQADDSALDVDTDGPRFGERGSRRAGPRSRTRRTPGTSSVIPFRHGLRMPSSTTFGTTSTSMTGSSLQAGPASSSESTPVRCSKSGRWSAAEARPSGNERTPSCGTPCSGSAPRSKRVAGC